MDSNMMYDNLLEKIKHFVGLYEKVKAEKAALVKTTEQLQSEIKALQNENSALKAKCAELNETVADLNTKLSSQDSVNSEIESKLMELLHALPEDKDESEDEVSSENAIQTQLPDTHIPETAAAETPMAANAEYLNGRDDLSDAILNKFLDADPDEQTEDLNRFLDDIKVDVNNPDSVPAPQTDAAAAEQTADNHADEPTFGGLFDTGSDEAPHNSDIVDMTDGQVYSEQASLWNAEANSAPTEDTQRVDETAMSFFDTVNQGETQPAAAEADSAQNDETNRAETGSSETAWHSEETQPATESAYAAGTIENDDYNSILFDDSAEDEEIDFDMDDEESDGGEEDLQGGSYEDGYADGVL